MSGSLATNPTRTGCWCQECTISLSSRQEGGWTTTTIYASLLPPVEIFTRWLGGEAVRAPPPPNISDISAAVKSDDEVCIMTGAATALQASHIVPKAAAEWFFFHYRVLMGYGGDPDEDLNSVRNQVTLRADLNGQGIDQGLFLFAPYADRVVAVFAKTMGQDLAHEYHLRAVDFPTRIRRGYLFIRFAWNVFKFLSPFVVEDFDLTSRAIHSGPAILALRRRYSGPDRARNECVTARRDGSHHAPVFCVFTTRTHTRCVVSRRPSVLCPAVDVLHLAHGLDLNECRISIKGRLTG
ncbi:37S ribosomal protein [Mycena sanguinolenta]|uniref:37S ribosomal protein n=1 Tax=Mycena sanguinolenta TaxID=230812 RepID=A0A8H7CQD7_9AGAR|nr:37S ribosomal protein [Mycena sanguinolenta]